MGAAVTGVKAEASRLSGVGASLKSGLRGAWSKVAGLDTLAMLVLGLVGVAACASPIAMWSAYHSGFAVQAERDRAAAAQAVATETARQERVIETASAKLAKADTAERAEIARLKHIAARLDHKRPTRLCPTTVNDVLQEAGYTPMPGARVIRAALLALAVALSGCTRTVAVMQPRGRDPGRHADLPARARPAPGHYRRRRGQRHRGPEGGGSCLPCPPRSHPRHPRCRALRRCP